MMYKEETIKRYTEKACSMLAEKLLSADRIKLHLSYGNKKIGKTLNFNLPAILTCGGMCKKCGCYKYCYAIKDALRFPAVMRARVENLALLLKFPGLYWSQVRDAIRRHKSYEYIRFHVSGEIQSIEYFAELVKTARLFPERVFWTYTKQYEIVNAYCAKNGGRSAIPKNLSVMFSDWDGYPMDNKNTFPVFQFVPAEKTAPAGVYHCPGNCDICKASGRGCMNRESACVMEH